MGGIKMYGVLTEKFILQTSGPCVGWGRGVEGPQNRLLVQKPAE